MIAALAAVAAALFAAVGVYIQYASQPSRVDIVVKPVGYKVDQTPDGQFVTVSYALVVSGTSPALNVRIKQVCEAVIPTPEPVLPGEWKSLGDLLPGKTSGLCFISSLKYAGPIQGIKQSIAVAWKNGSGQKVCSFDIHHIVNNDKELDVPSACM
jgi:hypothetical protein